MKAPYLPSRAPWSGNEIVLIHQSDEMKVRNHALYAPAKHGDLDAAATLIEQMGSDAIVAALTGGTEGPVVLLPVYAEEAEGANRIPLALARWIGVRTGWPVCTDVFQSNKVTRTRQDGYYRLALQPLFEGPVPGECKCILVDDFIGQGATLANLHGHVLDAGADVVGFTALTGKATSAALGLHAETLEALRAQHGQELENWWRYTFGYGFEALTESEARYLVRYTDAKRIRNEIIKRFR